MDRVYTAQHRITWAGINHEVRELYQNSAKYLVENDVVQIIQREDAFKSVQALVEAGIMKLPYSPMVMEFSATEQFRWFILMIDKGECIKCTAIFLHLPTDRTVYACPQADLYIEKDGMVCNGPEQMQHGHAIIAAATMALLFLNTKGIEKTHITCDALNKQRERKGRSLIPAVTVIRIATVYDRNGKATKHVSGGKMRVHLRAGYTRRQHYGPGNEQTKIVYIEPCLVNFQPGDEMPAAPSRRIKL
jgi:hypothetical protein